MSGLLLLVTGCTAANPVTAFLERVQAISHSSLKLGEVPPWKPPSRSIDSVDENVVCIKPRTARSKPFGAGGRSAARAIVGRQLQ